MARNRKWRLKTKPTWELPPVHLLLVRGVAHENRNPKRPLRLRERQWKPWNRRKPKPVPWNPWRHCPKSASLVHHKSHPLMMSNLSRTKSLGVVVAGLRPKAARLAGTLRTNPMPNPVRNRWSKWGINPKFQWLLCCFTLKLGMFFIRVCS